MGDFVHKGLHRARVGKIAQLGSHGGCGHGRLFGGQRAMQQLNQQETGGIHHARPEAIPEGRQAHCHDRELQARCDGGQRPATGRTAQHGPVLAAGAGDVVFPYLGAAFCHLGRQQGGAVGKQGTQAALVSAHAG